MADGIDTTGTTGRDASAALGEASTDFLSRPPNHRVDRSAPLHPLTGTPNNPS